MIWSLFGLPYTRGRYSSGGQVRKGGLWEMPFPLLAILLVVVVLVVLFAIFWVVRRWL
jgi:uncharacterized membrane protein